MRWLWLAWVALALALLFVGGVVWLVARFAVTDAIAYWGLTPPEDKR